MRAVCFTLGGFLAAIGILLVFIYPEGCSWVVCIVMAVLSVVAGSLLPPRAPHPIIHHVETESVRGSVSSSSKPQTSLIPHDSDMFSEGRIHQDLQTLVKKPGPLWQHFELQRQRRQREKEIQLVNQYGEFFSAATQTIKA